SCPSPLHIPLTLLHSPRPLPPSPLIHHPTPTPYLYPLSLHDALPIFRLCPHPHRPPGPGERRALGQPLPLRRGGGEADLREQHPDRKSTRLNSSHVSISYAVFCLKKKK